MFDILRKNSKIQQVSITFILCASHGALCCRDRHLTSAEGLSACSMQWDQCLGHCLHIVGVHYIPVLKSGPPSACPRAALFSGLRAAALMLRSVNEHWTKCYGAIGRWRPIHSGVREVLLWSLWELALRYLRQRTSAPSKTFPNKAKLLL